MSRVADDFAARFHAALRIKQTDKSAAGPYDRLNEFVRKLKALADVSACLDRYLAVYTRYPKDDPRSEMIFTMLVERRIKLTPLDDDFVDALYEDIYAKRRPFPKVAARVNELGPGSNRYNDVLKVLKEARDQRQRGGGIIDPLRQMYRRAHDGEAARSLEQLYDFDPWPDQELEKEYRRHVAAVSAVWAQAQKVFADRGYAYDKATAKSEKERLKNSGYAGFKLRFEEFTDFLKDKRADTRAVFQLLKWSRDPLRKTKEVRGSQTRVKGGNAGHIDYEIYAHVVLAVYVNAVGHRNLIRKPEGFTSAEREFLLDPMEKADYYSNFLNRFKLFFHGPVQAVVAKGAPAPARPIGPTSNVEVFGSLAKLYSQLILFGKSQNLDLVSDAEMLKLQRKIKSTPWDELLTRRFSTVGMSNWPYANDSFAIGARIGTGIRIAYFDAGKPTSIYLELDDAPGFLFRAHKWTFARKVAEGLFQLLWEYNKGLIVLIQKYFEIVGYLPVLVEAGVWGLVREVIQDQLIDAGLEDASTAFGTDLNGLGMILGALAPSHGPHGTRIDDTAHLAAGPDVFKLSPPQATAKKGGLGTLTDDAAKQTNRLTPTDPGSAAVLGSRLTGEEQRMAKVTDAALAPQQPPAAKAMDRPRTPEEQRAAKATADRPPTTEEQRAAKAMERPLSIEDKRMRKAIDKWLEKHHHRMTQAQAQIAQGKGEVLQRAQVVSGAQGRNAVAQAGPGGALQTQAARANAGGGGGPATTGRVESAGAPDAPRPRAERKVVTVEPKPKAPEPPPPVKPETPFHELTGMQMQNIELRKLVLGRYADQIQTAMVDPLEFLGIHASVPVDGRRVGGRNKVKQVAEQLMENSHLGVKAGMEPLNVKPIPYKGVINLIFGHGHEDLRADYERLYQLTQGVRVPEFERLNLSWKRINQISEELQGLAKREIGEMEFDIFEVWFRRNEVQIADLTQRLGDPFHLFKSRLYVRIAQLMLPEFTVTAFDIKPLANGSFRWIEIE